MSSPVRSTEDMLRDCFRHQHPEAFQQSPVLPPTLPADLRSRGEEVRETSTMFYPTEPMGNGQKLPGDVS